VAARCSHACSDSSSGPAGARRTEHHSSGPRPRISASMPYSPPIRSKKYPKCSATGKPKKIAAAKAPPIIMGPHSLPESAIRPSQVTTRKMTTPMKNPTPLTPRSYMSRSRELRPRRHNAFQVCTVHQPTIAKSSPKSPKMPARSSSSCNSWSSVRTDRLTGSSSRHRSRRPGQPQSPQHAFPA
jgi:hypothetical protein